MSSKSALKAVRTALDEKDFELAAEKASALARQEPENYHAYVLCALIALIYHLTLITAAMFS